MFKIKQLKTDLSFCITTDWNTFFFHWHILILKINNNWKIVTKVYRIINVYIIYHNAYSILKNI